MAEPITDSSAGTDAAEQSVTCAKCGASNPGAQRRCLSCDAHLHHYCRHCGERNERIASRCAHCGRSLRRTNFDRLKKKVMGSVEKRRLVRDLLLLVVMCLIVILALYACDRLPTE